jgi:inorganic pyrophosphatase
VWKENGVVAPIIEVKVLDQLREEYHLDVAEVDEKKSLDTETSIDYIELPKKQGNDGDEVDVCISHIDSKKYAYLAECKELTKGGTFPEIPVFVIE